MPGRNFQKTDGEQDEGREAESGFSQTRPTLVCPVLSPDKAWNKDVGEELQPGLARVVARRAGGSRPHDLGLALG